MLIKGDKKSNKLVGTDDDDTIRGFGGDDKITAIGGHDTVDAGDGDDKITISDDTSATIRAGSGKDKVNISEGALGSDIDLNGGADTVVVGNSTQLAQAFTIAGNGGDDTVKFALDQSEYDVVENGDGAYTVTDANGNSYALTSISALTFNGALYQEPGNPINTAPVVSNQIADQTVNEDAALSFQFASDAFTDADNDALTYTATLANGDALPSWLSFNGATRTFTGTPPDNGVFAVRVTASDGSLTASDDFNITVNDVVTPPPPPPVIVDPVVTNGVLYLDKFYDYDVSESGGVISVSYAGKNMTYASSSVTSVYTQGSSSVDVDTVGWALRDIDGDVNFTNVTFTQAGPPAVKFEASFDINESFDVTGDISVNGGKEGYFMARWDFVDDSYTYYDEVNAKQAVDLGLEYLQYLADGGTPLTGVVAKFTQDNGDTDTIPQRWQSLHDNLLGNLDENSIRDKFSEGVVGDNSDEYTVGDILAYVQANTPNGWDVLGSLASITDGRGVFSGDQSDLNGAKHGQVLAWDYAHGIARDDYGFFDDSGTVDKQAIDSATGNMYFGTGNSPQNYVVAQHEGEGIETALKVHLRQGADIAGTVTAGNVVTFDVPTGTQPAPNPDPSWGPPAAWSFDYSFVTGLNGNTTKVADFDFVLKIDTDSTSLVDYMEFNLPATDKGGNFGQDSVNFGFDFIEEELDNGNYNFGAGTFDIELIAYEKGSAHALSDILSSVHIQVLV